MTVCINEADALRAGKSFSFIPSVTCARILSRVLLGTFEGLKNVNCSYSQARKSIRP
jgi:hypothetical protein